MAIEQPIVGTVLEWCISQTGRAFDEVEQELGFESGLLGTWVSEDKKPNLGQLRKLSAFFSRPESFFFLPSPPEPQAVAVEFRRFAGSDKIPGPETLAAVELARKVQKTSAWLRQKSEDQSPDLPELRVGSNIERSALKLRSWLEWSTPFQTSGASEAVVTRALRSSLEDQGIVVMHASMDEGVTRGFSIFSKSAPLLAINSREPYRPRLFSYMHELVHLSIGSTSICNLHEVDGRVESYCNKVAAAILMPADEFRAHVRTRMGTRKLASLEDVSQVRALFKVSLRAAAIRAEDLGLGNPGLFDVVDREAEVKKRGGQFVPGNERTKPVIRVDEYGRAFIRAIENGVESGVLKEPQAASLLRLSFAEWKSAKMLVEGAAA